MSQGNEGKDYRKAKYSIPSSTTYNNQTIDSGYSSVKHSNKGLVVKQKQADSQLAQAIRRSLNGSEGSGGRAAVLQEEASRNSRSKNAQLIEAGGDNGAYYGQVPESEHLSNARVLGELNPKAIFQDQQYSSEQERAQIELMRRSGTPQDSHYQEFQVSYLEQDSQNSAGGPIRAMKSKNTNSVPLLQHSLPQVVEIPREDLDYYYDRPMNAQSTVSLHAQKQNQYRSSGPRPLKVNWKKLQLQDDKNLEIERENRILLSKMQRIYNSKPQQAYSGLKNRPGFQQNIAGGRAGALVDDSVMEASKENHRRNTQLKRKWKKEKIDQENRRMLERLQNKKSIYNIDKWEQEEFQRQKLLKMVSKEPKHRQLALGPRDLVLVERSQSPAIGSRPNSSGSVGRRGKRSPSMPSLFADDEQYKPARPHDELRAQLQRYYQSTLNPQKPKYRRGGLSNGQHRSISIDKAPQSYAMPALNVMEGSPSHIQRLGQPIRNSVLFSKGLLINDQFYLCEITQNQRGYYIRLSPIDKGFLPSPTHSSNLQLFLGHDNLTTHQILTHHQRNFASIAHSLKVRNGRIVVGLDGHPSKQGVGVMGSSPKNDEDATDRAGKYSMSQEKLHPRQSGRRRHGASTTMEERHGMDGAEDEEHHVVGPTLGGHASDTHIKRFMKNFSNHVAADRATLPIKPQFNPLLIYQHTTLTRPKQIVSAKSQKKFSQLQLRQNKSLKFRKGSGADAGDDLIIHLDHKMRKTVDSSANASKIVRSRPEMQVISNDVGHQDDFAVQLHEIGKQNMKQNTRIPVLKGSTLPAEQRSHKVDRHFANGKNSAVPDSSASRTLMANSMISANRPLDAELGVQQEHRYRRAHYIPTKNKMAIERKGLQQHYSSILKHPQYNAANQARATLDRQNGHEWSNNNQVAASDAQGATYDPAAHYSNRSQTVSKASTSQTNSKERAQQQIVLIKQPVSKTRPYRKQALGQHLEGHHLGKGSPNQGAQIGENRPLYGHRQSITHSEEPRRPKIAESNSMVDLPSIYNSKQSSINAKVSGAVPSFPERYPNHANEIMNLRVQDYLNKQKGNIIINIGPVSQSNIKTVELVDPYGSKHVDRHHQNEQRNSIEFRRNTAKANLYDDHRHQQMQPVQKEEQDVQQAYELRPKKAAKRRPNNEVFERLSRSKSQKEAKTLSEKRSSKSGVQGNVKQTPTNANAQGLQPTTEGASSSPDLKNFNALNKSKPPDKDRQLQIKESSIVSTIQNKIPTDSTKSKVNKIIQQHEKKLLEKEKQKRILEQQKELLQQRRLNFKNKELKTSSPNSTMKKSVNSDLVDLRIGMGIRQDQRPQKRLDQKSRQSQSFKIVDADVSMFKTDESIKELAQKKRLIPKRNDDSRQLLANHQHMRSSIHNIKSPSASRGAQPPYHESKDQGKQQSNQNLKEYQGSDSRQATQLEHSSRLTVSSVQKKLNQTNQGYQMPSYYDDQNPPSLHQHLHQMRLQTQQNLTGGAASHLYGDGDSSANNEHNIRKSMVKTNQFGKIGTKLGKAGSGRASSRNDEPAGTKRSRVEESGELLQPESLLEEIKREVSEYSQSQQRQFTKSQRSKNAEIKTKTGEDIQETSSEGSDAYVTPAMLKQKQKRTIEREEERKSAGGDLKKNAAHEVRNGETDQAHQEEDRAKNGEDDCVSFSGQVRSSDLHHTQPAEVRQMNQTGQFSMEPRTTNQHESMSASQKQGSLGPDERRQRIQGARPEVEADEPVPPRVDEDSSAADGYSNDFVPDTSSSRGGKYGQVDDSLDAMRLNSFPSLKKLGKTDHAPSRPRIEHRADRNEKCSDMLIQKDLVVNLDPTLSKEPRRLAAQNDDKDADEYYSELDNNNDDADEKDSMGIPYRLDKEYPGKHRERGEGPEQPQRTLPRQEAVLTDNKESLLSSQYRGGAHDPYHQEPQEESENTDSQYFRRLQANDIQATSKMLRREFRQDSRAQGTSSSRERAPHFSRMLSMEQEQLNTGKNQVKEQSNLGNANDPSVTFSNQLNQVENAKKASKRSDSEDFYSDDFQDATSERGNRREDSVQE